MIDIPTDAKIYVYSKPIDMRKGFAFAIGEMKELFNKHDNKDIYFLYMNANKTIVKIVQYDGFALQAWYKKLFYGEFDTLIKDGEITKEDLFALLSGLKRYNVAISGY